MLAPFNQAYNLAPIQTYFDESIFRGGLLYRPYQVIYARNKADDYLLRTVVKREPNQLQKLYAVTQNDLHPRDFPKTKQSALTLNCNTPDASIKVCTLKPELYMSTQFLCPAFAVECINDELSPVGSMCRKKVKDIKEIECEPFDDAHIYTCNLALTNMEMAIMLKYYAINHPNVRITYDLYCQTKDYLADRVPFKLPSQVEPAHMPPLDAFSRFRILI